MEKIQTFFSSIRSLAQGLKEQKRNRYRLAILLDFLCIAVIFLHGLHIQDSLSSLISPVPGLFPLGQRKSTNEVFGFAPFWTFDNLENVDFSTLTTFAYFGIPVNPDGSLDTTDPGYETFESDKATQIFKKAHSVGTRVVLTLTQMDNGSINALMDDLNAQDLAIRQTIAEVKQRGIDGVNIDFEYVGNPGEHYQTAFSNFVSKLTSEMHAEIPFSYVTVSVYASAVKDPKIYDIRRLSQVTDGIFMMAYDFAITSSDNAIPTAPLYGYKQGEYWYDVSTAVNDFLTQMPANKLILGVPWYGYNYLVYEPGVKAETRPYYTWRGQPMAQTYGAAAKITPSTPGISDYKTGWDNNGKVGWKAYYDADAGTWRMVFEEDAKSLGIKYDFAKSKKLAGVGIWALGFDEGRKELWAVLRDKFGQKLADNRFLGGFSQ